MSREAATLRVIPACYRKRFRTGSVARSSGLWNFIGGCRRLRRLVVRFPL